MKAYTDSVAKNFNILREKMSPESFERCRALAAKYRSEATKYRSAMEVKVKAYTDGACRVSNPGQTSCAWVIFQEDDNGPKYEGSRYLGPELHTNNYAEYQGLLDLLKYAAKHKIMGLEIYCDSKLVVNQVNDVWDVNSQELMPLCVLAYALRIRGGHTLQHIHGHSGDPGNEYVDHLCNEALDKEGIGK